MKVLQTTFLNHRQTMYIGDNKWKCLNHPKNQSLRCDKIFKSKKQAINHVCFESEGE